MGLGRGGERNNRNERNKKHLTRQRTYCKGDEGKEGRGMTSTTLQIARHAEFRMKMAPRSRRRSLRPVFAKQIPPISLNRHERIRFFLSLSAVQSLLTQTRYTRSSPSPSPSSSSSSSSSSSPPSSSPFYTVEPT